MNKHIQLEKSFIQNEFIQAPPVYSVIYVYLLNKAENNIVKINLHKLEDEVNIPVTEILNCLKYFDRKKLLSVNTELSGDTIIIFNAGEKNYNLKPKKEQLIEKQLEVNEHIVKDVQLKNKKNYEINEIKEIINKNDEISELFSYVEEVTGALLDINDLNIVYSFYEYYMLPAGVIHFLVAYCVNNNKRNLKYMEKIAQDWSKNNIKSLDEAEKYLTNYNKEYKQILDALGVKTGVVEANKNIMDKWLMTDKISIELIIEACKRTVIQTGSSSLNYVETILQGWVKSGIKTIEEVKKSDKSFKESKKNSQKNNNQPFKSQKPKFTDYQQRNLDFDKLQREAMKKKLNNGSVK